MEIILGSSTLLSYLLCGLVFIFEWIFLPLAPALAVASECIQSRMGEQKELRQRKG